MTYLQIVGVRLTIDVSRRLIVSTFYGEINDAEVLSVASLIRSHPDFDPSFSEIADFSGVTGGTLSTSAIRELSQRESILSPTSMHVALAPQGHIFGVFRMAQVLAEQTRPNTAVVRTIDEAHKFLGLEEAG
ncbi:MAG: hypothetical protein WCF68_20915 [Terriglobales bacterium]